MLPGAFATSRGDDDNGNCVEVNDCVREEFEEPPNESSRLGLSQPQRLPELLGEDRARNSFTTSVLALLGLLVVLGIPALTLLEATDKSTDALSSYLDGLTNAILWLVMLVAGYYFGQRTSNRRKSS